MAVFLLRKKEVAKNNSHDEAVLSLLIQPITEKVRAGTGLIMSVHLNGTFCFNPKTLDHE